MMGIKILSYYFVCLPVSEILSGPQVGWFGLYPVKNLGLTEEIQSSFPGETW